jgi:hypothetical protein
MNRRQFFDVFLSFLCGGLLFRTSGKALVLAFAFPEDLQSFSDKHTGNKYSDYL